MTRNKGTKPAGTVVVSEYSGAERDNRQCLLLYLMGG
jgi:hypothetical protein